MAKTTKQSLLFEIFLKIAVIFFLYGVFNSTLKLTYDIHNAFWEPIVRVLVIILFLGLALITIAMRGGNFRSFAFMMIFVISALRIFTTFASNGMDLDDIPTYVLLMVVSIYIIYRTSDHSHSHRR